MPPFQGCRNEVKCQQTNYVHSYLLAAKLPNKLLYQVHNLKMVCL